MAGAHVDLLISPSNGTYAQNQNPFQARTIYLGIGLGFLGLIGFRKRAKQLLVALMVVCVIVGAASMLGGCDARPVTIVVTATPTDKTAPAQTLELVVGK